MGVLGDIAVSSDGRSLVWERDYPAEWVQQTQADAAFSAGTYLFDGAAGFPSLTIFANTLTENEIAALVKYYLLGRPNVAAIDSVKVTRLSRTDRTWQVDAALRLKTGDAIQFNLA